MKNQHWVDMVQKMLTVIPDRCTDLIAEFQSMLEKMPEENHPRDRIFVTLTKHVPHPCVDWQYQIWSWFSAKNINDVKQQFQQPN